MEKSDWVSDIFQTQNENDLPKLDMECKAKMSKWSMAPESLD